MTEPSSSSKVRTVVGCGLLALGVAVFAARLVHEGAYAMPRGANLFGGLGALLLYHKRHFMAGPYAESLPADSPQRALMGFLGQKYGYSKAALGRATQRVVEVLDALDAQLAGQHARGRRYLVGEALTALDIYWGASCGFLDPMPENRCPMCTDFRAPNLYGTPNDAIERALTPALRAHRDFVYEQHLELPIVF